MKGLFWVGPRESDIASTNDLFEGSITLFGVNSPHNVSYSEEIKMRVNHNIVTQDQVDFINEKLYQLMESRGDVVFMSYNPNQVFACGEDVIKRTVCLNSQVIMKFIDEKISFRRWAEKLVPTFHSEELRGHQCSYQDLQNKFNNHGTYVIQSNVSCGGYGTTVMNKDNHRLVSGLITLEQMYLVSPFVVNSIPINIHAIIYDEDIVLTPASIQIMVPNDDRVLYRGADFITYWDINSSLDLEFRKNSLVLCKNLQAMGYRGVCGIDAMIIDNSVYFLEINNRFQASTPTLNRALIENNLPSINEMNYEAFFQSKPSCNPANISVHYSNFVYISCSNNLHSRHILDSASKEPSVVEVYTDGYDNVLSQANESYLYKVLFNTNITSISSDSAVILHPNIAQPTEAWLREIYNGHDLLKTKIALLNQGCALSTSAEEYLVKCGGVREGVNNAVDIYLEHIIVNSPLRVKLCSFSPFLIDFTEDDLVLRYYGEVISKISIKSFDSYCERLTSNGIKMKNICFIATDRIRIQHSFSCFFRKSKLECKFCESVPEELTGFSLEDVYESIDTYVAVYNEQFKHFLIGGSSESKKNEHHNILAISRYLRKKTDLPVYLMCLPPNNPEDIKEYFAAGITEIAFNIEVFDRARAKEIMPGKGMIPLSQYMKALEFAVSLWGNIGSVRTVFVVGLETTESLLFGIEEVCKLGVVPILSVFRPIPGTPLADYVPPSNQSLLNLFYQADEICKRYGLSLGPQCPECQNNTLGMTNFVKQDFNNNLLK